MRTIARTNLPQYPRNTFEKELYQDRAKTVVGIDEAGRGSLAGPLAVAAVVFPQQVFTSKMPKELSMIQDSKKLTPAQREECYDIVDKWAVFAETVYISNRWIDKININRATELAIIYLIRRLQKRSFCGLSVLVDGNFRLPLLRQRFPFLDYTSIIQGDSRVLSIAAASIIAKVSRDRRMRALAELFPGYFLERNKGYPTSQHRSQISKMGVSLIHRRTYAL